MIEVDPINQCLSKCRLEWFVPGVEELGSRGWLYCGAVWSAIFGAGTREPVVEPLICVCVTGKCFLASLARCCRLKLAALGRSGPRGAVHVGSWAWHSNTWAWCGVFPAGVYWHVLPGFLSSSSLELFICQVETNIELVSRYT